MQGLRFEGEGRWNGRGGLEKDRQPKREHPVSGPKRV